MNHLTYSERLRDPRWQKRRLEIFERDNWTCQSCGSKDKNLQVHHLRYHKSIEPWEYPSHLLVTYCEICHETEHLIGDQVRSIFLELINANRIYIRPLAQVNTLIENYPPFYESLKNFLIESMQEYLKMKQAA